MDGDADGTDGDADGTDGDADGMATREAVVASECLEFETMIDDWKHLVKSAQFERW